MQKKSAKTTLSTSKGKKQEKEKTLKDVDADTKQTFGTTGTQVLVDNLINT